MPLPGLSRSLASTVASLARRAGVTIHWWPANRFTAMDDALALLKRRGYGPKTIIDVGANVGDWTELAGAIFSGATFHMIEPQPECIEALRRFTPPRHHVHNLVVTSPGVASVRMSGVGSSGAWVMTQEQTAHDAVYRATTLDELLAHALRADDRTLLKLDVEGHELEVLTGASQVLSKTEVLLTEVRFFDIESSGRPVFFDVMTYLESHSFQLHDVAALGSRRRDERLNQGDVIFVRKDSALALDTRWA